MPPPRKSIHDRAYKVLVACLRQARRDADVTQVQLAARLRADQSYVSKYERAQRRLDVIEVRAICQALNVEFIDFVRAVEDALGRARLR